MRIYTNETTSKHYISYAAAVLSMVEAGFALVSNVDQTAEGIEDKGSKAAFRRATSGLFGTAPVEYGYISYLDTEDEIATHADIEAIA